jgi:hypothetical protein
MPQEVSFVCIVQCCLHKREGGQDCSERPHIYQRTPVVPHYNWEEEKKKMGNSSRRCSWAATMAMGLVCSPAGLPSAIYCRWHPQRDLLCSPQALHLQRFRRQRQLRHQKCQHRLFQLPARHLSRHQPRGHRRPHHHQGRQGIHQFPHLSPYRWGLCRWSPNSILGCRLHRHTY